MMQDFVIMLLFVSFFLAGLLLIGGIYEYILCPIWDRWMERRRRRNVWR